MKRLCCCLSLLLSLCLLFPVFSVSISAISVDGYDVFTSVFDPSLGDYKEFDSTISLDNSTDQLSIIFDIHLPEVIKKNTIFDLEVDFSLGKYSPTNFSGVGTMFDSDWNQLDGVLSGIVEDGKLKESQIIAEGNVKYIRYIFDYYYPTWHIVNVDSFNGTDLTGTTWKLNYGWTATAGLGEFYITGKFTNDTNTVDINQKLQIGYKQTTPKVDYVSWDNKSYMYAPYSYYFAFTGGTDVTNPILIDWLQTNATLQSSDNQSLKYTFDFAVLSVSLTQEEGETGIFAGIFGWIKKIYNSILDIPNKIADLIKGLFVPSDETIIELKDKFEVLLADRFGAAYQSIEVVEQFGQAMGISTYSDTVDTITFPSVTVPLAGTEFTFGGWEVDLVPKGFEGLITPLKLIVDLVCTIACVNMFRRRMEGVLR